MVTKADIRRDMRRRKAECPIDERTTLSARITAALTQHPRWQAAQTVLLYHSLPDEVYTHDLIRQALDERKKVLLPVVVGDDLELRPLQHEDDLQEGAFHILEPQGIEFTDYDAIDLAVIPGMAFTRDGRRLGRGRGYYDRLLSRLTRSKDSLSPQHTYTIGLAWPFQILTDLPTEPHDITLDEVISVWLPK